MPAEGQVIEVADPTVAVVAIDPTQLDVPTGIHALVVSALATPHVLSLSVDSLGQPGSGFILDQAGREIWRQPQPIGDINALIQGINGQAANLQATTDGHWLTITSTAAGTSQRLKITLDGTDGKVTEDQPAGDASLTVDQAQVACIGNVGRAAGIQIEAVGVGKTTATVSQSRMPKYMFPLVMGYLLILILVAILYKVEPGHIFRWLPSEMGPVPISVPLFGAIGAVIISLQGLFLHGQAWLPSYNLWHIARPFVGAVLGFVAVLFLVLLIDAAQASGTTTSSTTTTTTTTSTPTAAVGTNPTTPTTTTTGTTSPKNSAPGSGAVGGLSAVIVYDVIAFIVGYREETFRNLLTRVTDVILGPSGLTGSAGTTPN